MTLLQEINKEETEKYVTKFLSTYFEEYSKLTELGASYKIIDSKEEADSNRTKTLNLIILSDKRLRQKDATSNAIEAAVESVRNIGEKIDSDILSGTEIKELNKDCTQDFSKVHLKVDKVKVKFFDEGVIEGTDINLLEECKIAVITEVFWKVEVNV